VLAADRRQGGLWIGFFLGGIAYFSDGQVRASYTAADGLGAGRVSDFQSTMTVRSGSRPKVGLAG
jgi:ligand-binding sensor domain-containing protein